MATTGASPPLQRARGQARIAVRSDRGVTRLRENFQAGSAKVRFPRARHGAPVEIVLLNTAGGLTGGDHLRFTIAAEDGACGVATTQAAERVYRRSAGVARVETALAVGAGATLEWLPQETIVFDRSALSRTLTADVDPSGCLLAVEAIVLGRAAMGETVHEVSLHDSWRIRRDGKLVFADGLRLEGDATSVLKSGATGANATATATLVLVAPEAGDKLDAVRAVLSEAEGEAGASSWNGILVARLLAPSGHALRADLIRLIEVLRGTPMPRVWNC